MNGESGSPWGLHEYGGVSIVTKEKKITIMFELTGVLKRVGIGGSVGASIATFAWSYLKGYKAMQQTFATTTMLLKKAAISAGVAGMAGLVVTAALGIGLYAFKKKLKLGKNKFIAW